MECMENQTFSICDDDEEEEEEEEEEGDGWMPRIAAKLMCFNMNYFS